MKQSRLLRTSLLAALALLLAACGGSAPAATATPAPTAAPTLVTIDLPPTATPLAAADATATAAASESGTAIEAPATATAAPGESPATQILTVGVNAEFQPFLFKDAEGNLAGIDIDLLQAIGSVANLEVAFVDTTFTDVLAGVRDGGYDAGMAAISITPARQAEMLFSEPYFTTGQMPVSFFSAGQGLAVPVASTIASASDLTPDARIGVKAATTGADYALANLQGEIIEYPEAEVLFAALVAGEVDAAVLDNAVLAEYILANPDTLRMAGGPLLQEEYAIAVKPGGEAIVASLNDALATLKTNGTYQTILDKWLAP